MVEIDHEKGKATFTQAPSQTPMVIQPIKIIDPIQKSKEIGELLVEYVNKEPDTNDELLQFESKGGHSVCVSLSSLESLADEDIDFSSIFKWGPRFDKFTEMLGDLQEQEKEQNCIITEIEDNFMPTQDEENYYLKCFQFCDVNNTGHLTTTELLQGLEWMNENPFGQRKRRAVDTIYVDDICRRYNIGKHFILELPEFINLMEHEKVSRK